MEWQEYRFDDDAVNREDRYAIERECERLIAQYCHYVDHGEAAKIADLFSEDGRWWNVAASWDGRQAIREGFQRRQDNAGRMSRHVCTNVLVDAISETEAKAVTYMSLYFHDGDPERETSPTDCLQKLGEYRDEFIRTDDGWRFRRREVISNFWRVSD